MSDTVLRTIAPDRVAPGRQRETIMKIPTTVPNSLTLKITDPRFAVAVLVTLLSFLFDPASQAGAASSTNLLMYFDFDSESGGIVQDESDFKPGRRSERRGSDRSNARRRRTQWPGWRSSFELQLDRPDHQPELFCGHQHRVLLGPETGR